MKRLLFGCCALSLLLVTAWAEEKAPISEKQREEMTAGWKREVAEANAQLAKDAKLIRAYSDRGDAELFLGETKAAVADYEKMIELDSSLDAGHWRLGIAYYFAGEYAKSARQFEKYHAYDGRDRENGIWKFLAQAKVDGVEKARKEMLVYERFDREPFPTLYAMFAGKMTPDEFFADLEKRGLSNDEGVMFFANYYGGLGEDLRGNRAKAVELLGKAVASSLADSPRGPGYMWQVARLQWEKLKAGK
jgi:lipoprotein NlpI